MRNMHAEKIRRLVGTRAECRAMNVSMEADNVTPVYLQTADRIRAAVDRGEYRVNERLPSEPDLAQQLNVARGTLRKAISLLVSDGLLRRVHGKGTFVIPQPINSGMVTSLSSLAEELKRQGIDFVTTVHASRIIPSEGVEAAVLLKVRGNERIFELHRSRSDDMGPIAYFENFVAIDSDDQADRFASADYARQPLFNVIEEVKSTKIAGGQRTMTAVAATRRVADLLEVDEASPLLFMEQVSFTAMGDPIECSHIWIVPDRMRISALVPR